MLTINGASFAPGSYALSITGTSGSVTHSVSVPFNVGDYSISGTQSLALAPGRQGTANLTLTSLNFYGGEINANCDASALAGAMCTLSPVNPINVASRGTAPLAVSINVPNNANPGNYPIQISTQDTTGAPSHAFTVTVVIGQDFEVISSPPNQSQTVNPGQTTGAYNLTIQPVGASFNAAVTLTCLASSLPALTQCRFNPAAPVTPGNSAASVVMTISTTSSTANAQRMGYLFGLWLLMPGIVIGSVAVSRNAVPGGSASRTARRLVLLVILGTLVALLLSCGGASTGGGGGGGGNGGTPAGTYTISVTGTSPGAPSD